MMIKHMTNIKLLILTICLLCTVTIAFKRNSWASSKIEIHTAKLSAYNQRIEKTINYGLTFTNKPQVFAYFERVAWQNDNTQEEEINYDLFIDEKSINETHCVLVLDLLRGGNNFHGYIRWVAFDDAQLYASTVNYPSYDKFSFNSDRGAPQFAVAFLQSAYYQGPADSIQVSIKNITSKFIQVKFESPAAVKLKTAKALVLMWFEEFSCTGFEYSSKIFKPTEAQASITQLNYPIIDEELKFNPIIVFTGIRGYNSQISQIDVSAQLSDSKTNYDQNFVTVSTQVGSTRSTVNQVFWTQIVCNELEAQIDFDLNTTIDPFVNGIFLTGFIGGALVLIAIFAILAKPEEAELRKNKKQQEHHDHDEEKTLAKKDNK